MRAKVLVAMGAVALLLAATQGLSQLPSRGSSKSRGGSMDPTEFFNRLANGKNVWVRAEATSSFSQSMFDRIAERLGITNGQITREQFEVYTQQRAAERAGGSPSGPPQPAPSGGKSSGTQPSTGGAPADPPDQWAEASFRRYDANGDGVLNYDEMPETLRAERTQWDTNKDGFIDLNEYKAYYRARMQQRAAERGGSWSSQQPPPEWGLPSVPPVEEEEQRPVVYRAGKLPKDLPAWFQQLDTDNDGQIGLYEWKTSGRSLEEFEQIDRNGDGFLTVEEVLRYQAEAKNRRPAPSAGGEARSSTSGGEGNTRGRGRGNRGSR